MTLQTLRRFLTLQTLRRFLALQVRRRFLAQRSQHVGLDDNRVAARGSMRRGYRRYVHAKAIQQERSRRRHEPTPKHLRS